METKKVPTIQPFLSEKKPRIWALGAIGGLGSSIVIATFSYIASVLDVANEWFYIVNQLLFFSVGIFLCQKVFMSQNKNYMSYRQGLTLVALIGIVGGILLASLNIFLINYFSDNYYFEETNIYPEKIDFITSFFFQNILDCIKYAFLSAVILLALSKTQNSNIIEQYNRRKAL